MARPRGHLLSPPAWEDALRYSGLSLTEAAERARVPRATISGLLGGHHRAAMPVARTLAYTLGCRVETLFPSMLPAYSETEPEVEVA